MLPASSVTAYLLAAATLTRSLWPQVAVPVPSLDSSGFRAVARELLDDCKAVIEVTPNNYLVTPRNYPQQLNGRNVNDLQLPSHTLRQSALLVYRKGKGGEMAPNIRNNSNSITL